MDTLISYVKAHPGEFDDSMIAYNAGFALEPFVKQNLDDPAKLHEKLAALSAAFASVAPNGRTNFYWAIARTLLKHDAALSFAEMVGRKSVDEISQADYIAAEREERQRHAKYLAEKAKKEGGKSPGGKAV